MKRILCMLCALTLAIGLLVACGKSPGSDAAPSVSTQPTEGATVPGGVTYYCIIMESGTDEPALYPIADMDVGKFDALVEFFERNAYDPFSANKGVKTRQVPYSVWKEPEIRFAKSSDGGFSGEGAGNFYLWEGKLLLEWYTWSDEYLVVVDVPDALSQYFVEIVDGLKA